MHTHKTTLASLACGSALAAAALVSVLFLYNHGSGSQVAASLFSDVPDTHPYMREIGYLYAKGIVKGYPDGSFGPDDAVTRAQLVKMVMEATSTAEQRRDCVTQVGNVPLFTDVPDAGVMWFGPHLCLAEQAGVVRGYDDGSFRPEQDLTVAETIKIVILAFGIPVSQYPEEYLWYVPYVMAANGMGAIAPEWTVASQTTTRGPLSYMIARVLLSQEPAVPDPVPAPELSPIPAAPTPLRQTVVIPVPARPLPESEPVTVSTPAPVAAAASSAPLTSGSSAAGVASSLPQSISAVSVTSSSSSAGSMASSSSLPVVASSSSRSVSSVPVPSSSSSASRAGPRCGDGTIQAPEMCDGGPVCAADCTLTQRIMTDNKVRMAANGRGQAAMIDTHYGITVSWFDGTRWQAPKVLAGPPESWQIPDHLYGLTLSDNGDAVAIFYDGSSNGAKLKLMRWNGNAGAGASTSVVATFGYAEYLNNPMPVMAADEKGGVTVAYATLNYYSGTPLSYVAYNDAANPARNNVITSPTTAGTRYGGAAVAMGKNGQAFVSWVDQYPTGSHSLIRGMYSAGGGVWNAPEILSDIRSAFPDPALVTIDAAGRVTIAVSIDAPCDDGNGGSTGIFVKRLSGGTWSNVGNCVRGGGMQAYLNLVSSFRTDEQGSVLFTTFRPGSMWGTLESRFFDAANPAAGWNAPSAIPNPRASGTPTTIVLGQNGKAAAAYVIAGEYQRLEEGLPGHSLQAYGTVYDKSTGWGPAIPLESGYPQLTANNNVAVSAVGPTFFWSRAVATYFDAVQPQFSRP